MDSGAVSAHTVLRWCYEKKGMHREALAAFEENEFSLATRLLHASNERVYWRL